MNYHLTLSCHSALQRFMPSLCDHFKARCFSFAATLQYCFGLTALTAFSLEAAGCSFQRKSPKNQLYTTCSTKQQTGTARDYSLQWQRESTFTSVLC